jgi:two-component system sensor histidine kinase HydH
MSASVGLLAALLALGMSSAPGWRELRWFAACAAFAALFNLANAPVTMPGMSRDVLLLASRLNLFFGGLHAATWFVFIAGQERRRLTRFEQPVVVGAFLLSFLTLVPGLVVENLVEPRYVAHIGATYSDSPPTFFGQLAVVYYVGCVSYLLGRAIIRWRRGDRFARTQALALGFVVFGATHDVLATADVIRSGYVLDFSLVALVLVVGGSITARFVASMRELAAAQQQLVAKERLAALGELSAVVAHEVRNPLAVVFNALAGLRRPSVNEEERGALLEILQEEAERLREIVSDLLEFASPRQPVSAPASLDEIVRGAVDSARNAVGSDPDEVIIEAGPRMELECDERLVRQAVINLVTNALQAAGRSGPVRVSIRDGDGRLTVRVADDGDGVPEDIRERVFTPFFSTRSKGTGLGLAVVKRCADAHGGQVTLVANRPRGALFELHLPRSGER